MIHDKNKRNWDKNIINACITKRSDIYRIDECTLWSPEIKALGTIYLICYFIFHSLENIISVFQASFTALEIANCHMIYLSTNYLLIN